MRHSGFRVVADSAVCKVMQRSLFSKRPRPQCRRDGTLNGPINRTAI
jgi:hypothetical protein